MDEEKFVLAGERGSKNFLIFPKIAKLNSNFNFKLGTSRSKFYFIQTPIHRNNSPSSNFYSS